MVARSFHVTGDPCPQLTMRILGVFARISMMPKRFECRDLGDVLEIWIEASIEEDRSSALLEQQIQRIIGVRQIRSDEVL